MCEILGGPVTDGGRASVIGADAATGTAATGTAATGTAATGTAATGTAETVNLIVTLSELSQSTNRLERC